MIHDPEQTNRRSCAAIGTHGDPLLNGNSEEELLCAALQHPKFRHRYDALDRIIADELDTPTIARALTATWHNYAGPAASLLFALDNMYERHPEVFQDEFLPLRRALLHEPAQWERLQRNPTWQAIIAVLYLPLGAPFQPDQINRDSPLTPHILAALHQPFPNQALPSLLDTLVPLASQPGSALARDAALVLSCVDDTRWVEACVISSRDNRARLIPLAAALVFARAHALVRALDLDLAHARDVAMVLRSPTYITNIVRRRSSELDHVRTFALGLVPTLATARKLDIDLKYARDMAQTLENVRDLENDLEYVQAIEYSIAGTPCQHLAVLDTIQAIRRLLETAISLSWVWADIIASVDRDDTGDPWQQ